MFVFAVIGVSLFAADSPHYFGNLETGILLMKCVLSLDIMRIERRQKVADGYYYLYATRPL